MSNVERPTSTGKTIEFVAPKRQRIASSRSRRRATRRRRRCAALGLACLIVVIGVAAWVIADSAVNSGTRRPAEHRIRVEQPARHRGPSATSRPGRPATHARGASNAGQGRITTPPSTVKASAGPYAVGIVHLRLVDHSRTVALPGEGAAPRTLLTSVRYPAIGRPGNTEHPAAVPAAGPFPLVVFGHGFDVTPGIYARLLDAWAKAGYVVAAPIFPLSNPNAPGGPNEHDLPNQPGDVSFVITRLLAADAASGAPLHNLITRHAIAVAGQSDGGDTALAAAYDPRDRDPRIRAAVVLSGAYDPFVTTFAFAPGGPPLLATQGTADQINLPSSTAAFYDRARPPKYLLQLLGAGHLPPYTNGQPQLGVVEQVTTAFLDKYLKDEAKAGRRMRRAGNVAGVATFRADP